MNVFNNNKVPTYKVAVNEREIDIKSSNMHASKIQKCQ